jgi:hypothetical protein
MTGRDRRQADADRLPAAPVAPGASLLGRGDRRVAETEREQRARVRLASSPGIEASANGARGDPSM